MNAKGSMRQFWSVCSRLNDSVTTHFLGSPEKYTTPLWFAPACPAESLVTLASYAKYIVAILFSIGSLSDSMNNLIGLL